MFTELAISPRPQPDLADGYPLVLTCAKSVRFTESHHRQIATLCRATPDPQIEIRPDAAADPLSETTSHGTTLVIPVRK